MPDRFTDTDWAFAQRLRGRSPTVPPWDLLQIHDLQVGDWVLDLRHGSRAGAVLRVDEVPNTAGIMVKCVAVAWDNRPEQLCKMGRNRLRLVRRFHPGDPVITPDGPGVVSELGHHTRRIRFWVKHPGWPGTSTHLIETIHHERQLYGVGDAVYHKAQQWIGRVAAYDGSIVKVFCKDGPIRMVLRPSMLIKCP